MSSTPISKGCDFAIIALFSINLLIAAHSAPAFQSAKAFSFYSSVCFALGGIFITSNSIKLKN
jgi:hypothetical protein